MIMDFGKSVSLDSNCKSHRPLSPSLKSHVEMLCFLSEWGEGGRMWHFILEAGVEESLTCSILRL